MNRNIPKSLEKNRTEHPEQAQTRLLLKKQSNQDALPLVKGNLSKF